MAAAQTMGRICRALAQELYLVPDGKFNTIFFTLDESA
jgi:hypothetical protein